MPTYSNRLSGFAEGDAITIRRTISRITSGLAAGVTITKAWMTCKTNKGDADPGLWQKAITTTDVPGTGQIENDGTGDVNPILRFDLNPADTRRAGISAEPGLYYDVQVKTNGGAVYTPENGTLLAEDEITVTDS